MSFEFSCEKNQTNENKNEDANVFWNFTFSFICFYNNLFVDR
jgi:hypothetical protein